MYCARALLIVWLSSIFSTLLGVVHCLIVLEQQGSVLDFSKSIIYFLTENALCITLREIFTLSTHTWSSSLSLRRSAAHFFLQCTTILEKLFFMIDLKHHLPYNCLLIIYKVCFSPKNLQCHLCHKPSVHVHVGVFLYSITIIELFVYPDPFYEMQLNSINNIL
jgi:hypothetical protein